MNNEQDQKIFVQLLEYYREMGEESSEDDDFDEESSDDYESRELEFHKKYPLLKELNVYDDWKGVYINIGNFTPRGEGKYTRWMLPTVFGARSEKLTQERHEFEMFYFGRILEPDSSRKCFDVVCV